MSVRKRERVSEQDRQGERICPHTTYTQSSSPPLLLPHPTQVQEEVLEETVGQYFLLLTLLIRNGDTNGR